jgi:hypothetical protein
MGDFMNSIQFAKNQIVAKLNMKSLVAGLAAGFLVSGIIIPIGAMAQESTFVVREVLKKTVFDISVGKSDEKSLINSTEAKASGNYLNLGATQTLLEGFSARGALRFQDQLLSFQPVGADTNTSQRAVEISRFDFGAKGSADANFTTIIFGGDLHLVRGLEQTKVTRAGLDSFSPYFGYESFLGKFPWTARFVGKFYRNWSQSQLNAQTVNLAAGGNGILGSAGNQAGFVTSFGVPIYQKLSLGFTLGVYREDLDLGNFVSGDRNNEYLSSLMAEYTFDPSTRIQFNLNSRNQASESMNAVETSLGLVRAL